jgi:DNA modification methylase
MTGGTKDFGMPQTGPACRKCGAHRIDSQLGLEATPDLYVANMVAVFHEVKRVLRDDGTLWLNLGDSYAGGAGGRGDSGNLIDGRPTSMKHDGQRIQRDCGILKPKDLVGIPWRVAFALQADGWYLRSDVIWSKPNPMPESVTDRPTKAHEYVFLMTKSARYFYDADAIADTATNGERFHGGYDSDAILTKTASRNGRNGIHRGPDSDTAMNVTSTRNRRTVWTIATQPFAEAHFATFPEKLVEPCVLAGCPEGGTVLDPFTGSGTTGVVACRLGRKFVGVELNPEYAAMAERRIAPWANQLVMEVEP